MKSLSPSRLIIWLLSIICLTGCEFSYEVPQAHYVRGRSTQRDRAFAAAVCRSDVYGAQRWVTPRNAIRPIQGFAPVLIATARGSSEMVKLLVDNGASFQQRDAQGHSLAFVAASNGHTAVARELVERGAGNEDDLSSGELAYNQAKSDDSNIGGWLLLAGGLLALAALSSGGNSDAEHSGGSGSNEINTSGIERDQRYRDENRDALRSGQSLPHPGYTPSW